MDNLKYINLYAKPEELDGLKWQELKNFKNLEVLYYHSRVYRLDDYANYDSFLVLPMSEIRIKLNSLPTYPSGILANKDWYARWIKNNPAYKDDRILNVLNQCK